MAERGETGELRILIAELDRRVDLRFELNDKALAAALLAAKEAVAAALTAAKEAVDKAETAAGKRFEATNEFRGQLADQAATFMPREVAEQQYRTLEARLAAVESTEYRHQGGQEARTGVSANVLVVVAVLALLVSVLAATHAVG